MSYPVFFQDVDFQMLPNCFISDILIFPSSTGCSQSGSLEPQAIGIYFPLGILLLPFKIKLSLLDSFLKALWKGELRTGTAVYIWEFHFCWLWVCEGRRREIQEKYSSCPSLFTSRRYPAARTTVNWQEKRSSRVYEYVWLSGSRNLDLGCWKGWMMELSVQHRFDVSSLES